MNTGFSNLDKLLDIEQPQLIFLSGTNFVDIFSGDIANNVCLHQEKEVLEIVSINKEYLIKRIFVNEANVNYKKWTLKTQYTDDELIQIGKSTLKLIEVTKRLPIIIEQNYMIGLRDIEKCVKKFANIYADREKVDSLVILDITPFNYSRYIRNYKYEIHRFVKSINKISKKLKCPIIMIYDVDKDIYNINKYVNKYVVVNETSNNIFNVSVLDKNMPIGTCKMRYDFEHRKFMEY